METVNLQQLSLKNYGMHFHGTTTQFHNGQFKSYCERSRFTWGVGGIFR